MMDELVAAKLEIRDEISPHSASCNLSVVGWWRRRLLRASLSAFLRARLIQTWPSLIDGLIVGAT
jgi:hypothetical protein